MKAKSWMAVLSLATLVSVAGCGNAGNTAGFAGNDLVNGTQRGVQHVGNAAGNVGNAAGHGLRRGANAVGNAAGAVGNGVGRGVNAVGNAAGAVGNGVANATRRGADVMGNATNRVAGGVAGGAGAAAAGAARGTGALAGTATDASRQSVQVNAGTKTVTIYVNGLNMNATRARGGMGLMGRQSPFASGMTVSIPRDWTVNVSTAKGANLGDLSIVSYSGKAQDLLNGTGTLNTHATRVSKTGANNATVFHAHTAGTYAVVTTTGNGQTNNVWDLITVTNTNTLPSISSNYTF